MKHFNYDFCFGSFFGFVLFFGFSHSLPFLDFLKEEEDSSEAVLIPTRSNTTYTAIKHWSLKKTTNVQIHAHALIYNICVTILPWNFQ